MRDTLLLDPSNDIGARRMQQFLHGKTLFAKVDVFNNTPHTESQKEYEYVPPEDEYYYDYEIYRSNSRWAELTDIEYAERLRCDCYDCRQVREEVHNHYGFRPPTQRIVYREYEVPVARMGACFVGIFDTRLASNWFMEFHFNTGQILAKPPWMFYGMTCVDMQEQLFRGNVMARITAKLKEYLVGKGFTLKEGEKLFSYTEENIPPEEKLVCKAKTFNFSASMKQVFQRRYRRVVEV